VPIYEYRCQSCGRRFEILQRMGAGSAGLTCPACGRAELEKELSTFASAAVAGATGTASCAPSARFT